MINKEIEKAKKNINDSKQYNTSGIVPKWEDIDIIMQYVEQLESENNNVKKVLKRDIRECKNEIISTQGSKQRKELSGAARRHLASLSGRQNEAIRILNILEGENHE